MIGSDFGEWGKSEGREYYCWVATYAWGCSMRRQRKERWREWVEGVRWAKDGALKTLMAWIRTHSGAGWTHGFFPVCGSQVHGVLVSTHPWIRGMKNCSLFIAFLTPGNKPIILLSAEIQQ